LARRRRQSSTDPDSNSPEDCETHPELSSDEHSVDRTFGDSLDQSPMSQDPVNSELLNISGRIASLEDLIAERLRNDALHEQQIHRLYLELDSYKSGERQELLLTLVRGLLLVLDDFPSIESQAGSELSYLREKLLEALVAVDVHVIPESIAAADSSLNQVVGFLDSDSAVDVELVRDGFRFGDRILRRREIRVRPTGR
jgi:molecular chaperone GrpE (heat shock protein)